MDVLRLLLGMFVVGVAFGLPFTAAYLAYWLTGSVLPGAAGFWFGIGSLLAAGVSLVP
jgi:hypothetical protein